MPEIFQIQVSPKEAAIPELLKQKIANLNSIPLKEITHIEIKKRSIDARQKLIKINLKVMMNFLKLH